MIYSDLYFKQKQKVSNFLMIFTFVFSVLIFSSIYRKLRITSRASKIDLKRIEITNLNPIQATIFWQTETKETGWLIYGEKENILDKIVFDDRDIATSQNKYFNHYVTLKNLKNDTTYYFMIISDNKKIIRPDGKYFSFKTPKTISNLTKLSPISGKILNENLTPLNSGVVLFSINNKNLYSLSFLLKNSGEWLIPLNSFYKQDNISEVAIGENDKATIEIFNEDGKKTTLIGKIKDLLSKTQILIIGKNYNLSQEENVLAAIDKNENKNIIDVIYPQEGAIIPGRQPLIKGFSYPYSEINLTLSSKTKTYSTKIKADKNGQWNYSIPEILDLGDYTLTFLTKNDKNQDLKIIRHFKITGNNAIEGKVLGEATNSANIITPTNIIPSPTMIYDSPTIIPTNMPKSGNFNYLTVLSSIAFLLAGVGILLVF